MVTYWKFQGFIDSAVALVATAIVLRANDFGIPVLFLVSGQQIADAARTWLGPILTLLGMTNATVAFIFSVLDRKDFDIIRKSGVEDQLFYIFSESIFWLAASAILVVLLTFSSELDTILILSISIFIFFINSICVSKLTWVMRQIISVRISRTRNRP